MTCPSIAQSTFMTAALLALSFTATASTLPTGTTTNSSLSSSSPQVPYPTFQCPTDTTPWQITNLTLFFPSASSQNLYEAYLCFHFCDHSPGLEVETECVRNVPLSSNSSSNSGGRSEGGSAEGSGLSAPGLFFDCEDNTVGFEYNGNGYLTVKRSFVDPCVGTPDIVTAFGDGAAKFVRETTELGTWLWAGSLEIVVSRLDA